MQRTIFCILVLGAGWCCPGLALAQESLPPVEKWQIKGILAALEDGYPEVQGMAARKLKELLWDDEVEKRPLRKWNGNLDQLAEKAKDALLKLLKLRQFDVQRNAAAALGRFKSDESYPGTAQAPQP